MRSLLIIGALSLSQLAAAQDAVPDMQAISTTTEVTQLAQMPIAANPDQEICISVMSSFPDDNSTTRYQFLKLTQDIAKGSSAAFRSALKYFGDHEVPFETPVLDVIEAVANPVIRQAAPKLTISNMAYMIEFHNLCGSYIDGQVESLAAFDKTLSAPAMNVVIGEDALYLRQILNDTLYRLGAQDDANFGYIIRDYANHLVTTRNNIEFTSFEASVDDIESSYMTDLDGRLARSNDLINKEINRSVLNESIALLDDMNEEASRKRKQQDMRTLIEILNRYGRITF